MREELLEIRYECADKNFFIVPLKRGNIDETKIQIQQKCAL